MQSHTARPTRSETIDQQWFLCTARFRRPKLFLDEGASTVDLEPHFKRFGNRIGYAWLWSSNSNGGWELGWVDVRTAFSPAVSVSFNNVKDSLGIKGFAIGARGDMAYLEGVASNAKHPRGAERIGYHVDREERSARVSTAPGRPIDDQPAPYPTGQGKRRPGGVTLRAPS